MCGLTGIWQPGEDPGYLREQVERMTRTLIHRGPDDYGSYLDEGAGFAVGFRRLAIIDLTPSGHQPMRSANGRFVVAFNGEIYNFRELRHELESQGVTFRGGSDTEVIVEAWALWGGAAILGRLWGMFAIAMWDHEDRTLTLARDRLGKKPMYWSDDGASGFLFGSELKALAAHPEFQHTLDHAALHSYLRFGYVPGEATVYRTARKLPPGTSLERRADGRVRIETYWSAPDVVRAGRGSEQLGDREATDHLDALLGDAVERRMVADVPLGVLLSGGIDSSVVAALMQARSPRPVRTFTIGFPVSEYDEANAARTVAGHLKTDHTELYVTPADALAVVPRLPEIWDEPFADPSQIPTYLVSALARGFVTVVLSGDGGDEVFGGYTRYSWGERIRRMRRLPRSIRRGVGWLLARGSAEAWNRAYAVSSWALPRAWRVSLPGVKMRKLALLLETDSEDALYRRLVSLWDDPSEVLPTTGEVSNASQEANLLRAAPDFTDRMMLRDLVTYLPDDILVKVDRASMAASLEARAPLLDHRVVEWAWKIPSRLKRRDGLGKWILRQVLHRYVPERLVDRPKAGFGVPIDVWLRGPLRDWAEDLLSERVLREDGLLEPGVVRRSWESHLSGHANEQYRLWAILMLQAWRRHWKV